MIPPLDEALRDLLAKYVHAYGPNEMIAELQSVIDGIRDVQALDAQTVYTPLTNELTHMAKTITLRCRHCKINGTAKRRETDPAEATVRESACPDCVEGGWALLKWFSKDGAEIRRLNERTRQMEYYGLMLAARR